MPPPSPAHRALVIDDDEMSRELLTVLLEGEGYAVDSATSGEDALTQLSQSHHAYDVILTDLHMPGMVGAELAHQLRLACGPRPLLLAISASQPPPRDIAPYDGFLLKPFPIQAIAAALSNRASETQQAMDATAKTASRNPRKPRSRTDQLPIRSHQSRRSLVTSNVLSIAASAASDASNLGMSVPTSEQKLETHPQLAKPPVENGMTAMPALNEQIYRQLAGNMPSPQLQEMYKLCINDARKRIAAMRALVTEHDSAQFVREAHAIKGGSGMLGATELHRLAAALEVRGLSSGPQAGPRDVNSLDELCAACDRLERMLGSRV